MKKLFTSFAVLTLVFLLFASPVAAEQFDGFSIDFPAGFTGAYTDVDTDTESDFFTETLAYKTESNYELMQVLMGESTNLDALFAENFGFANRQDLDLSLLTEKQLADEAEELTAYIDMSFPLYMTYVTPQSMMVDDRLCLMVTGYYTDYQGGLTGEFRAYEFYYMGQVIIVYYDTQIEGTYFVENVFDLPDSIVKTMDFDLDPAAQPINASLYKDWVKTAAPVGGLLAAAVLLGILFGLAFKKSKHKNDDDTGFTLSPDIDDTVKTKDKKAPDAEKKSASKKSKKETKAKPTADPAAPVLPKADPSEAVDWASMLSTLKKDVEQTEKAQPQEAQEKAPKQEAAPSGTDEAPADTGKPETPKNEPKVIDERASKVSIEKTIPAESLHLNPDEPPAFTNEPASEVPEDEKKAVTDPLLAQLQEMDNMSAEISATLGTLESLSSTELKKEPVVLESAPEELTESEDIGLAELPPELDLPKSKNAESVSENYQSYMNSLLPTRKKPKKAEETPAKTDDTAKETSKTQAPALDDSVKPDLGTILADKKSPEPKAEEKTKKEKKQGILSRMLSSVADRIEKDGEENIEPEFDSRSEMHIREKTERHSVEKLMPGLFDEDPEEEHVEILLDQGEDLKFERNKSKEKKSDPDRNKHVKSRVDNLFND